MNNNSNRPTTFEWREKFLSKFKDLDKFLDDAKYQVMYYFNKQKEKSTLEEFRTFLKWRIIRYLECYHQATDEDKRKEWCKIEEEYKRLFDFWEIDKKIEDILFWTSGWVGEILENKEV